MTLAEFKAWFEGFTESMEGAPNADQFAKIKAKVALIDGTPVTYPIYVERYVPHHPHPWPYWTNPIWAGGAVGYGVSLDAVGNDTARITFDSISAMNALGRAEAMH